MLLRINPIQIFSNSRCLTALQRGRNRPKQCFSTAAPSDYPPPPFAFNEQEIQRILSLINTKSGGDLASYDISKTKLNKLEIWKSKNGEFRNLNDILHLDGFSTKVVEKFCKSLLNETPAKKSKRKAASFITPPLPEAQLKQINSSVSVNIGVSSIIWSRLELNADGPCELTHWQRHDLIEKKLHLNDLIQRCLYVDNLIPSADCYVFESPQVAQASTPGNAEQVNINIQRAQLTAILGFALAKRNTSENRSKPNVFYLRKYLAARLFQHLVGTERVSAEKTILNLMRTCYNVDDVLDTEEDVGEELFSSRGNVSFSQELRTMYKGAEACNREWLGQTLLLNLAFVRLVLLQDPKSRARVSRSSAASQDE